MKTKFTIFMLGGMLFTHLALAGVDISGGANAVVCFKEQFKDIAKDIAEQIRKGEGDASLYDHLDKIEMIEVYDLYEAKLQWGLDEKVQPQIIEVQENEKLRDYSERIAERFEKTVPVISELIRKGIERFPREHIRNHKGRVIFKNDTDNIGLLPNICVLTTLAVQENSKEDYYLHLNESLFNHEKHSLQSKAVLFLHEILYSLVRQVQNNSNYTRKLVEILITENNHISVAQLLQTGKNLGFLQGDVFETYPYRLMEKTLENVLNFTKTQFVKFEKENGSSLLDEILPKVMKLTGGYNLPFTSLDTLEYFIEYQLRWGFFENHHKQLQEFLNRIKQYKDLRTNVLTMLFQEYYRSEFESDILAIPFAPEGVKQKANEKIHEYLSTVLKGNLKETMYPRSSEITVFIDLQPWMLVVDLSGLAQDISKTIEFDLNYIIP